jgi:hypothetical protein
VTWAEPELDDGDELLVPDDELLVPDDELPVPDDDPVVLEPPEVEWADDDPDEDLTEVPDALAAVCVELGRITASPPATARPRTPVPAVTARSRPRARSRFTTAVTVRGSLLLIMNSFRDANTPNFP